jgi:hypothetical protein
MPRSCGSELDDASLLPDTDEPPETDVPPDTEPAPFETDPDAPTPALGLAVGPTLVLVSLPVVPDGMPPPDVDEPMLGGAGAGLVARGAAVDGVGEMVDGEALGLAFPTAASACWLQRSKSACVGVDA